MKKNYFIKLIIPVFICFGWNFNAAAQTPTTFTFNGTTGLFGSGVNGTPQSYVVPPGVTQIAVDMMGAAGGYACCTTYPVSLGGRVQCTMNVTPGSTLYVYVGGAGASNPSTSTQGPGGWNGGGAGGQPGDAFAASGGGASDIRTSTTGPYASSVLVVAGGAGGGGDFGPMGGSGGGITGGSGGGGACGGGQTGPSCGTGFALGSQGQGANANYYSCGGGGGGWWGGNAGVLYDGAGGGGSSYPATPNSVVTAIIHTQGYSLANGNGKVVITPLCVNPGAVVVANPVMCLGASTTVSNPTGAPGGTWVSSNPGVATVDGTGNVTSVSAGTTTITYNTPGTPCGGSMATATITINPLPAAVGGATTVCSGLTATVTDASSGGTWSTSSPGTLSIGASSGVINGIAAGTATLTYTLPTGCLTTSTFTVNANPAPITFATSGAVCVGSTITMNDGTSGGTWTGSFPLIASVGAGSGVVTGLSSGVDTIYYTMPTSCVTSALVTVNPLPSAISGLPNVCVGASTTLTDGTPGGTWSVSNPGMASIGVVTGTITGIVAGSVTATYTLGSTGCRTTSSIAIDPLPAAITGSTSVCTGGTTTLSSASTGGTWSSGATTTATIGAATGIVTGVAAGTAPMTYTLVTGCSTTASILVNPSPAAFPLTGGGPYCASAGTGSHVGLTYGNAGVDYQLILSGSGPVGSPVSGSNASLDFGAQYIAGTYTAQATNTTTGCTSNMTGSAVVTILASPVMHNVSGGGGYCIGGSGATVGLDGSTPGTKYQLYYGSTPVGGLVSGTGAPISFGSFTGTGTYTVIGTTTSTGCSAMMAGSASVYINPLPNAYPVSGGGGYCAGGSGVHIVLLNSDAGNTYTVMMGTSSLGSTYSSTGGYLDLGAYTTPGTYTVVGQDGSTLCSNNMTGSATVVINPLPTAYTVTPTAPTSYCAGGAGVHVGLTYSSTGVDYTLWYGGTPGATVHGSGSGLDFGAQTGVGSYSIMATNPLTGCTNLMTGSASIGVNPLPTAYNVTGGGGYCAGSTGVNISTDGSDFGVNYRLYRGTTPVGLPVAGIGGTGISFGTFTTPGTYTAVATNAYTGCVNNLGSSATVNTNPLPIIYNVTGGGSFCAGDTGVHVRLNNSQAGVNYQLIASGAPTSVILAGTGGALDFGLQTSAGLYTVAASNATTGCQANMAGSATVLVNPLPTAFNVTGGGWYCTGGTGVHVGIDNSSTGTSYQLLLFSVPVGLPQSGTGTAIDFGVKTAVGSYTVTARNLATGCTNTMNGAAGVATLPLPTAYAVTGGGNYCAGGTGVDIGLSSSDDFVTYYLVRGLTVVDSMTGAALSPVDFGNQTAAGTYSVIAWNGTCNGAMSGTASVGIVSPARFAMTGGGSYCAGGTGVDVTQGGSSITETYQLYTDTGAVGLPMPGTGSSLDFGLQTHAGTYYAVATNIAYGCVDTMTGLSTVVVNALPTLNNVTGGGSFCAGGSGVHVSLDGSSTGISYQLYNGGSTVGTAVAGTGSSLDFGLHTTPGTYTVTARNLGTGCGDTMTGGATITVMPLPTPYIVGIENDGYYCAADTTGVHIYLGSSDTGVTYTLLRGTTLLSTMTGTGAMLDLGRQLISGTYEISAVNGAGCADNMSGTVTVTIMPLPTVHNVTGGGSFCPNAPGVHIGLDNSDPGIRYTLMRVGHPTDTMSIWGSGFPLDFGIFDTLGTYTVNGTAHHLLTGCSNDMFGSATVSLDTILKPSVRLQAFPGTGIGVYHVDSMHALVSNGGPNPTFQWIINGHIIPGATNASFTHYEFFNKDSVACRVTASGPCGGLDSSAYLIITLHTVGVNTITAQGSDVKLIPNPNKGAFTVKGSIGTTDEDVTVEVTNMMGQVVYTGKVTAQNGAIDQRIELGNVANGMYLLNLRSGDQNVVFHFVVEQ